MQFYVWPKKETMLAIKPKAELQNVTDMTDISVKKNWPVGGKKFGRTKKISKNKPFSGRFVQKYKIQWTNYYELIVYPHLFITRNLPSSVL